MNTAKPNVLKQLDNAQCGGHIMLEPRLQEYLRKKQIYKENGIESCISLEQEYQITNLDKKILRCFLKGKRDIYNNAGFQLNNVKTQPVKQEFESKKYRNYDKYDKVTPKKKVYEKPDNMGLFVPDKNEAYYDHINRNVDDILDHRDFNKHNIGSLLITSNKYSNVDIATNQKCDIVNKSKCVQGFSNNGSLLDDDTKDLLKTFDNSYRRKMASENDVRRIPKQHIGSELLDNETKELLDEFRRPDDKITIRSNPNDMHRSRRVKKNVIDNCGNQFNPLLDIDVDTEIKLGIPTHTKKTYGYDNPEKHYFDFLEDSDEFTTCGLEDWTRGGIVTRVDNKKTARKTINRELY